MFQFLNSRELLEPPFSARMITATPALCVEIHWQSLFLHRKFEGEYRVVFRKPSTGHLTTVRIDKGENPILRR